MRRVLIVGAGQSGLQLGLSLLAEGFEVTVMSARTPQEVRSGWPTSTQVMFHPALETERRYDLNLWEEQTRRSRASSSGSRRRPAPSRWR